jgi:hypothetical protein
MKPTYGLLLAGCALLGGDGAAGLRRVADLDLVATANPAGAELLGALSLRRGWSGGDPYAPDTYLQGGVLALATPDYAAAGAFAEWQPFPFLQLHVQGGRYQYFGGGDLISLPAPDAPYGTGDLDRRKDSARAGSARNLQAQPVLQAQAGPVVLRHQATFSWFRFSGGGPWFYEPENDLLLARSDRVEDNLTQVFWEFKPTWGTVLAGPAVQTTRGKEAGLFRRRVGLAGSWQAAGEWGKAGRPRAFLNLARDQADRNREGQVFLAVGIGTTWLH